MTTINFLDFSTTARILLSEGAALRLAPIVSDHGGSSVFVVTDAGLVRAGIIEPILASLREAGLVVSVFDQVVADPPVQVVLDAVAAGQGAGADLVLGIGGGSALDTAKLVAYLLKTPCPLESIYGVNNAKGQRLPMILVPTTAGTGSEVTPIAIVTTEAGDKQGIVSARLIPDVAVLDPLTTVSMPPAATAATGIDAMVHALEAYTSKIKKNALSDMLAKEALRLLLLNFPVVMQNPSDLLARGQMQLGSCLAGMAFANAPVGAVHALAYPIGVRLHAPHGLSNALMLLPVLQFNMRVAATLYDELAVALGLEQGDAAGLFKALTQLLASSGLPSRLRDIGAVETDIPLLAADAMRQTRLLVNNPVEVTLDDAMALYRAAF